MLGNICLRLSSSAHSPLTAGFQLQYPWPEAGKTAEYSPFFARKAAARPPEAIFLGAILGFFGQLQGIFRAPLAICFGFLANCREFLRRLGEVDSTRGNFLAPKQTKKTERIQK